MTRVVTCAMSGDDAVRGASGSALAPRAPATVAHGVLAVLCRRVASPAAAITYRDGRSGHHRVLANGGYREPVMDYLVSEFVCTDPYFTLVRSSRDTPLFWADIPAFERSVLAVDLLVPSGYGEGTSVALGPDRHHVAGVLHVSFRGPDVDAAVRSVIAEFARSCSDLVAEQIARENLHLSPRELEVLRLVAAGLSNAEIAERLFVTRRTVATHLEHILAKTGTSSRVSAAVRAVQLGLIRV